MPLKALLACLVSALALACGGSSSDSSGPSQPGSGGAAGGPKLAWDQFAPSADELRKYSYVLYVDGTAVPLSGAACGTLAAETLTAACTAPLPAMAPGPHTLEMATRVTENGVVLESARSAPISYNAGASGFASGTSGATALVSGTGASGGGASTDSDPPGKGREAEASGFVVETVLTGLHRPTALAMLPDGRLVIAERGGAIRIAGRGGAPLPEPAAQLPDADASDDGVVSLAVAPDFEASRHVYVGYGAVDARGERRGRVVRFREAGGVLGEAAVILDGLPAALAAPWVAIGPDGALYVATSAADAGEAADLGSYAGKILRLGLDGTTPPDNPVPSSPVYSFGYRGSRGIGWEGQSGTLWALEAHDEGAALTRVPAGRPGIRAAGVGPIGSARMAFLPASAAGVPAAWRGSLFIAAPDEQSVLRLSGLSDSPPAPAVERLFQGEFGRIALVLAAEDGFYFATSNGTAGGDARAADAVYRVRERTTSGFVTRSRGWIQPPSAGHDTVSVSLPRRRESP